MVGPYFAKRFKRFEYNKSFFSLLMKRLWPMPKTENLDFVAFPPILGNRLDVSQKGEDLDGKWTFRQYLTGQMGFDPDTNRLQIWNIYLQVIVGALR